MRVAERGRIDRSRRIGFTFDGARHSAHPGDTVASALMASGVRLVGRSFKYHRPRGVLTAGSEEPNALVTVGYGASRRPNTRATMQEVYDGLEVRSQNAWPSLRRDALAVNDVLAPFLSAGFYYKTFMGPSGWWEKLYEPVIRRAAGLGALSGISVQDRDERAFAHCDLLVIGAGPAGLMAALAGAEAGADVILCDEGAEIGGRLLSEAERVDGVPSSDWAAGMARRLRAAGVRIMTRTTVTGAYDGGTYGALERVAEHLPQGDAPPRAFWRIAARAAVLASGAHERHVAFADNDRPGIMGAAAMRGYLHRWGAVASDRVALFGASDGIHRTARDLSEAGVEVAAVLDARDAAPDGGDWPVLTSARVTATAGRLGLARIEATHAKGRRRIEVGALGVSGGWNPAIGLACHLGARPVWREDIAAFVAPEGAVPGMVVAGAANGAASTAECLADGARAAARALDAAAAPAIPAADQSFERAMPFWEVAGTGRAWLDFQNDVTVKDVRQAAAEGYGAVEHMKRYTTQGMATDQGKNSNVAALAILADATGRGIPGTGTTTFRPPFVPVPIASLGAGARGAGFAPLRRTSSDAAARARGAPMIEAGLWHRPAYFPAPGETTWRESCDREAAMVRRSVGVCDVSTLGKIEIVGPDAPAFLDFVYAGRMSTLKPGRVRYGIMLREDGHVMDDGTCARLGADRWLVTTTTAAAGEVMQHFDFAAQVLRPELDVAFCSVTETWAQFAVAGPSSRALLGGLLDAPLEPEAWPFMSCGDVRVAGIPGRLFRISFSGEHAYELAVPARHGDALWRVLMATAEGLGGGPYGMEALNVLRIEKGLLTHAEIDGRVTAGDLGLRISDAKDCIGRTMAARPGLVAPERPALVGLRAVDGGRRITAGAHLFAEGAAPGPDTSDGHVSSACWSPALGACIGLGFLSRGRQRHGERVRMRDAMRGVEAICEVVPPVFIDPEGTRLRG